MTDNDSSEQQAAIDRSHRAAALARENYQPLEQHHKDTLFLQARSHNGWQDKEVDDDLLKELFELVKMGPTSMNTCPARFVFLKSDQAKQRLSPAVAEGNLAKTLSAPVVVLIGQDEAFYEHGAQLFPHQDIRPIFEGQDELNKTTAFRNSTLQGAYLMLAARSLGLDCGPMSGFDNDKADEIFFKGTAIKSNFLCCLGYGDISKLYQRLPRFDFDQVCSIS